MKRATFRRNTLVLALAIAYYGSAALALPAGLGATQGVGGVVTAGPVMTVTTQAGKSIANWQSFSIGAGEKVIINQPNAGSTMLNRVTGADPSAIYGRLQSNGAVWLVNPAGIMVGPGGRVDTAAFVASTLSVTNTDFLAGRLNFGGDAAAKLAGRITNDGEIRTPAGGSILIVAPQIENNGVMTSPGGEIILAAGHSVQVLNTGTPGVVVEVKAERGELNLSQMVASGKVFARNCGRVSASNVVAEGGRVFLRASPADGGVAVNTGTLEAEGAPGKGGFIDTSGSYLDVNAGKIDVGRGGTWLIDPLDVLIGSRTTISPPGGFVIYADSISDVLQKGSNTIFTVVPGYNVTVVSPIHSSGTGEMGLDVRGGDIILDGTGTNNGSIWLPNGVLRLQAGGSIRQLVDKPGRFAQASSQQGSIKVGKLVAAAGGTIDLFSSNNSIDKVALQAGGDISLWGTGRGVTLVSDAGPPTGPVSGITSTGGGDITVIAKSLTENPGSGIVTDGIVSITTTGGDVLLTTGASHIKKAAITSYGNILLGTMEDLQLVSFGGNAGLKSLNKGDIRVEAKSIKDSPGNGILTEGRFAVQALNDILLDHSSIGSLDWAESFDGNIRINNQGGRALELTGGVATHRSSRSVFIGNEGDLILKPGSYLGSDEGGEFVLAATGDFKNESGSANPLHLPNGRWLVYSADPAGIVKGGMVSDFRQYGTPASAGVTGTGNGFIYASAKPTVEVDVRNKYGATSHVYGDTPDVRLFPMTTAIGEADNEDYNMGFGLTSAFQYSLTPAADTAPGTYRIRYTGGLENSLGFTMVAGPGFDYMVIPSQAWLDAHRPVRPAGANTTAEDALLRASAPWGDFSNWPLTMAPCVAGPASAPRPGIVVIGSPRRSGNCG